MKLTDTDRITFGIHNGKRLIDVPASYLIWLYENNKCYGALKDYIVDNLEALKKEIKKK